MMPAVHPGELVPDRFSGSVASIHTGIINIDAGGYFVSLVSRHEDRTALSLYVSEPAPEGLLRGIAPGATVTGTPTGLEIAGFGRIRYAPEGTRFSGRIESGVAEITRILDPVTIGELLKELRDNTRYHRGFIPLLFPRPAPPPPAPPRPVPPLHTTPRDDPFLARARKILDAFNGDLSALVGLGVGFTPAGDDFIAGVLLAEDLRHMSRRDSGEDHGAPSRAPKSDTDLDREAVAAALHRTTTGGATMLRLALAGRPPLFVHRICDILADPDQPTASAPAVADRFGHSSGLDLLAGFAWRSVRI